MATATNPLTRLGLAIASVIVVVASLGAQSRPNFSGTWVAANPPKLPAREYVVKHDDKTLTSPLGRRVVVYQLDGSEQQSQVPFSGDVIRVSTRATWEKDRIVITIRTAYPTGMKTVIRETWSLDAQGRLIVDIVETMEGLPNKPDIQQMILIKK